MRAWQAYCRVPWRDSAMRGGRPRRPMLCAQCWAVLVCGLLLASFPVLVNAQGRGKQGRAKDSRLDQYLSEVPAYRGNVILARPTAQSVTANVMMNQAARVKVMFGTPGHLDRESASVDLKAGQPREIVLDGLQSDSAYEYRVADAASGSALVPEGGNGTFHTQRPRGAEFTFTVQADSHLDGNCQADMYKLTLANAAKEHPDFHIDLGDTFMTGKIAERQNAAKQYLAQRYYLGLVGCNAPVFLVLGNHDGEETRKGNGGEVGNLPAWSCQQRRLYFTNPVPDAFYSGNVTEYPGVGRLQDYYAWEWGDALFVVLDPYWYSSGNRGGREPWNTTLGKAQYDWLAGMLRRSKARFKFVFIHQLVGGLDQAGRGGAEAASFYEWGGREWDGKDTFGLNRAGWDKPIHALLVETGVTIVFHGHDHFYARQDLDGVVYQLVPQPGQPKPRNPQAGEYGYKTGDFLPSSGHVRVRVGPARVQVDYVRTALAGTRSSGVVNGQSSHTYICTAREILP